jgi:hypothetical protein
MKLGLPLPLSADSYIPLNIGHIHRISDIIGRLSILTGGAVHLRRMAVRHSRYFLPVFPPPMALSILLAQ